MKPGHGLFLILVVLAGPPHRPATAQDAAAPPLIELTFTGEVPPGLADMIVSTLAPPVPVAVPPAIVLDPMVFDLLRCDPVAAGAAGCLGQGTLFRGINLNSSALVASADDRRFDPAVFTGMSAPEVTLTMLRDDRVSIAQSLDSVTVDLTAGGFASRTFAVPPGTPPETLAAISAAAADAGAVALTIDRPQTELLDSAIAPVTAPALCPAEAAGGPFPREALIPTLDFNRRVFGRLGLVPHRARILIVDTGIGAALATSDVIVPFLDYDPNALLLRASIAITPTESQCLPDRTYLYGAATFGDQDAAPHPRCDTAWRALRPHDPALAPIVPVEGAQERYTPAHGSIVAGIAAGGPLMTARYPALADLLSLRVFRITERPLAGAPGSFRIESSFINRAVADGTAHGADIINMSLVTRAFRVEGELEAAGFDGGGTMLLVTAAGNLPLDISDAGSDGLPATLGDWDQVIAVAGLAPGPSGWAWWPDSARSPSLVQIAAPAAGIASLDDAGRPVCATGTSAAAPVVSFAAALVRSFGLRDPAAIKARLLDTADRDPALEDRVEDGRLLNVPRAVDLFSDILVRTDGMVLRGRLLPGDDGMIRVCAPPHPAGTLARSGGKIDPGVAGRWDRTGARTAEVVHHYETESNTETGCAVPDGFLQFRRHGIEDVQAVFYADVQTILFSPFRSAEVEAVLARIPF